MTISLPTQWSDGNGHIALALQRFDQLHQLFATEIWIFAQKPVVSRLNRQHALWKKAKGGPTLSTLTVETKLIPKQNGLLHGEAFSDLCGLADPKMWKGKNFWLERANQNAISRCYKTVTRPFGPHKSVSLCHIPTYAYMCWQFWHVHFNWSLLVVA